MMYSQYLRIEQRTPHGVASSPRQFIKAAHELLGRKGKAFGMRDTRHTWLREVLKQRTAEHQMIHQFKL